MGQDTALQHKIVWPLTTQEIRTACGDELLGLPTRAREVVYLAHRIWEMPDDIDVQFMDANVSWERLVKLSRGPWSSTMFTMVGSMRPVVRRRMDGGVVVRILHGKEALAMVGWSRNDYATDTAVEHHTLLSLAGNAFSAYSVGPILLATTLAMCSESRAYVKSPEEDGVSFVSSDEEDQS